jgi:pimeloyl-ACP methyl ester carboxylesterase
MQNLVLVPGLGSDSAVWRRTMLELDGWVNCLVGDTLHDRSLRAMAQRILDDAPPRFALAGVSMGGMVALEMMQMAPDRVTCLALVDTRVRPDTFSQLLYRHSVNLIVKAVDYRRLAKYSLGSLVHPSAAPGIRAELIEMSVRVGAKAYTVQNRAVIGRADLRSMLPSINIPTSVVVGAEDRMTPVEQSQEIHRLIPGATLQIIQECGHLPPIEKPEAMAKILLQLLGEGE